MKYSLKARGFRLLCLLLCAAMLMGLAACGSGKEKPEEPEKVETLAEATPEPTPVPTPEPTPNVESLAI